MLTAPGPQGVSHRIKTLPNSMILLRQLREFNEALILALVIFLILQFSIQNFKVEGSSMATTIEPGQYVAVNKLHKFKVDMARLSSLIPFWDASHQGEVYPSREMAPSGAMSSSSNFPLTPGQDLHKAGNRPPGRTGLHHPRSHPYRRRKTQRTLSQYQGPERDPRIRNPRPQRVFRHGR